MKSSSTNFQVHWDLMDRGFDGIGIHNTTLEKSSETSCSLRFTIPAALRKIAASPLKDSWVITKWDGYQLHAIPTGLFRQYIQFIQRNYNKSETFCTEAHSMAQSVSMDSKGRWTLHSGLLQQVSLRNGMNLTIRRGPPGSAWLEILSQEH